MKKEFKYEIKKHFGTVSTSEDGKYSTEVNLISYNNAPAKVDIRTWNRETGRMYKGITLRHTKQVLRNDHMSSRRYWQKLC